MSPGDAGERSWMIVEDETMLRSALSDMMKVWGITPLVFGNGNEAMDWLDRVESGSNDEPLPELALLDIRLPGGPQGTDIAERLRAVPSTASTPIVIMTAYRSDGDTRLEIERRLHPNLFLTKPLPALGKFKQMLESVIAGD